MLLSKVVSAILTDFIAAQDLSNEYASQISRKYKQYRDGNENILNNFDAPASLLKEVDLDLKFSVAGLNDDSYSLDIEETWNNCEKLASEAVKYVIPRIQALIERIIPEIPRLVGTEGASQSIDNSTAETNNSTIEVQGIWREVKNNLEKEEFIDSVKKKVYQKLFKTGKGLFLRGRESIEFETVKEIVKEKLQEGILDHPDFQESVKSTQEILPQVRRDQILTYIKDNTENIFTETADATVTERAVRTLLRKFAGVASHADVMLTPSFLRELPIETVSSLRLTAEMERYKWALTETGESLNKAKN